MDFLIEIRGLTYLPKSGGGREGQSNAPSVLTALQIELFYGYLIFKPQVFEHLSNQSLGSKVITRNIGLTKKFDCVISGSVRSSFMDMAIY